MPYIKELCKLSGVETVYVVSPVDDLEERRSMGWGDDNNHNKERYDGVYVVLAPAVEEVEALFQKYEGKDTWCMFSGINAFPEVSKWFRLSLKYNVKRGIITEPPYVYEHPLWQHAIRFAFKDWKYTKYIDKFYVMGDEYLWYYRMWSKRWDVIPFKYCTKWVDRTLPVPDNKELNVLYVGALSQRKNVPELLESIRGLSEDCQYSIRVGIVGDGEERKVCEKITASSDFKSNFFFYGNMNMNNIPEVMQEYDVLVLPSRHDGWGAVVNEALTLGLYVICSDHCGAKYLLQDDSNGMVYKTNDIESLKKKMQLCILKKNEIRQNVHKRIDWAKHNIKDEVVANYFMEKLTS